MEKFTDGSFNQYQTKATSLAVYPEAHTGHLHAVVYTSLALAGEAGEVANKVKKVFRGDKPLTDEVKTAISKELGGVLWYAAALANELGMTLESIAEANLVELFGRHERGTIQGDGDNR